MENKGFEPNTNNLERIILIYTTKEFKKRNYFTLYDEKENLICYFDNYRELEKKVNQPLWRIIQQFKKTKKFIKITINKKEYKLYTFCD